MPAAGVVAKAFTLLFLGIGVGAAHSVLQPVTLRMAESEPTVIRLPTPDRDPQASSTTNHAGQDSPGEGGSGEPAGEPSTGAGGEPDFIEPVIDMMTLTEKYLTLDQTRILWEAGVAQFFDARHLDEYVAGHIPRTTLWDPTDMYAGRLPEGFDYLDPQMPTIIYCGGGDCDASENLGRQLQQMGFSQIHIFKDGFPAWDAAGLPVNIGEPSASTPRPTNPGGSL